MDMIPSYEIIHDHYQLEFKGPNLEVKHCQEILARTLEMNAESICELGSDRFHVQSVMDPLCSYHVDLGNDSCECLDWPRIWFCKHVATVVHFFRHSHQWIGASEITVPTIIPLTREDSPGTHSNTSTSSILGDVISASMDYLNDEVPSTDQTNHSFEMIWAHLNATVHNSCASDSPLPDQEPIPPNQRTWTETTEEMGAKRQKRPQSGTTSPQPSATARIGDLNRKKAHIKILDPYSGGVSSGRNALPDAQSATQNTKARAHAAAAASSTLPLSQPWKRGLARVERKRNGMTMG